MILGYHRSLSWWFRKWLRTLILHLICRVMDIKADLTLNLVSARKFDSIWVIVDWLTKSDHFIPVHTKYRAKKYAEIYITRVIRLHRVMKTIVSDRGSQFVARFWEKLHASLATHLRNEVVSSLVWMWWVIDMPMFEFESGTFRWFYLYLCIVWRFTFACLVVCRWQL
jgi:hypothetical protein